MAENASNGGAPPPAAAASSAAPAPAPSASPAAPAKTTPNRSAVAASAASIAAAGSGGGLTKQQAQMHKLRDANAKYKNLLKMAKERIQAQEEEHREAAGGDQKGTGGFGHGEGEECRAEGCQRCHDEWWRSCC